MNSSVDPSALSQAASAEAAPPEIASPPLARSMLAQAVHDGEVRVRGLDLPADVSFDIYHRLMRMRWRWLFAAFGGVFLLFNLVFAGLYWLDPAGLAVSMPSIAAPPFVRDFFFSVDTVATIGYGNIYPVSLYANLVALAEISLGIVYFALATGIAFARFSRPTARILFSRVLILRDVDGVPTLMLRAANQRHNMIFSAGARMSVLVDGEVGGARMRRFLDLDLVRDSNPVFALTWTIMHPILPETPLARWIEGRAVPPDIEIIVVLSGIDEVSGQMLHGRWAYRGSDIRWNERFLDIMDVASDGTRTIHYARFHDTMPDATPA